MKFHFDANQAYQLTAVESVVDLFTGQGDRSSLHATSFAEAGELPLPVSQAYVNHLRIDDQQLLENVQMVQKRNGLGLSESLFEDDARSPQANTFPSITVEMETGTGKTYVYLRTMHELRKRYGFTKFVIVVPSVAIREGVLKSYEITKDHFSELYGCPRVECVVYDSRRLSTLRNFAFSDAMQILVISIDAFARDAEESAAGGKKKRGNVINQRRETGERPIDFIQACQPIVILDEPQNLETDPRVRAIGRLNPLCTLRYSATHRTKQNMVYSLDPVRAYELGLVKQIGVDSVIESNTSSSAFVEVLGFNQSRRSISAKLLIVSDGGAGPVKKRVTVKPGTDLFALSGGREAYRSNFIVNEIDASSGLVRFSNDVRARVGAPAGAYDEEIQKAQIRRTVERHFDKMRVLVPAGIKVLSVLFVDQVSNYRSYGSDGSFVDGPFAQWLEEEYERQSMVPENRKLAPFAASTIHSGYFAQDRRVVTPFATSATRSNAEAQDATFKLIMKDKERLLDLAEPVQFIFSHSALTEGWDNPNVFQICTLGERHSVVRKRQEIGRGLRLCVNQQGERIYDRSLNMLTVVANESYEEFAATLQKEMHEAGVAFREDMVKDERRRVKVTLNKGFDANPEFIALWERIKGRTKFSVHYDTEELIHAAAEHLRHALPPVMRPQLVLQRSEIRIQRSGVEAVQTGVQTEDFVLSQDAIPDVVSILRDRTALSRHVIGRILLECGRLEDLLRNPQAFVDQAVPLIAEVMNKVLVDGVEYRRVEGFEFEMRLFQLDAERETFGENIFEVADLSKTVFSHVEIDSSSSVELAFARDCDANEDVLFYLKLPDWFTIETPLGSYNPDWAVVYRNPGSLYFVAETKKTAGASQVNQGLLRPLEKWKIDCGQRHFAQFEGVQFKVVSSLQQLIR